MLLQLEVAQQRVLVVRRVVDDPATELRGGGAHAQGGDKQDDQDFLSHVLVPFFPQRFEGMV